MKYFSPEHKLLLLLYKIHNRVVGVFERFVTNDVFDVEKAKNVFAERGVSRTRLNTAVRALVSAGFADVRGITAAGIEKVGLIESERVSEIQRLGLNDFFTGVTGNFNQADMDELNNKEY